MPTSFTGSFKIVSPPPVITSQPIIAKTGEKIIISGNNFKYNIVQISGENPNDSGINFNYFSGSGLNNTTTQNTVAFTIPTDVVPSTYNVSLFNKSGASSNSVQIKIIDAPAISGTDITSGTPSDYIRISGSNLYPTISLKLVDSSGTVHIPTQDTSLYSAGYIFVNEGGTGYQTGTRFAITGKKTFEPNDTGLFEITSTGISGSINIISIIDSGKFTVIEPEYGLMHDFVLPNSSTTSSGNISILYNKYENTGDIQFIEFKIPTNIEKSFSGVVGNIKFKDEEAAVITGFNAIGLPNIFGFEPISGNVEQEIITLSGQNFSYVNKVFIGSKEVDFTIINDNIITFTIPNLSETNFIFISGIYGTDTSDQILNITYPGIFATGFSPNDILLGTGSVISFSGKYLQRINYIDLGKSKILRSNIEIDSNGTSGSFILPNTYQTSQINIYSIDFINTGFLIESPDTNNQLIATPKLDEKNINFRYLSGIQAAKYLDEIEFFSSTSVSGDYGNLSGVDVFFLTPTGNKFITGDYSVSGIKVEDSPTGLKIKIPREIKTPQSPIKIRRNKFGDEYLLSSYKSIDILPTIFAFKNNISTSNTGELIISGINAGNVNQIFLKSTSLKDPFGFKNVDYGQVEILSKNINQITGFEQGHLTGYTVFNARIGGDYVGGGNLFLFNKYYDTGIGYEDHNLLSTSFLTQRISGYRPKDSDAFTSEKIINVKLDRPFIYRIRTNTNTNKFEVYPSNEFGGGQGPAGTNIFDTNIFPDLLTRLNIVHNDPIISGVPASGGTYYLKIKGANGISNNESMLLQINIGNASGRDLDAPGIVYQGDWKNDFVYIGNELRRDVIFYDLGLSSGASGNQVGSRYWYAARDNINTPPEVNSNTWIQFTNEFGATATKILLAEQSNITNSLNIGKGGVFSGYIKTVNDIDINIGTGFYLGYDNSYNSGLAKFRVGNQSNYIKFDGVGLDIVGPVSGVLTTSREVTGTNNEIYSKYSVAIGFNNIIKNNSNNSMVVGANNTVDENTKNTFIFGENNITTGGQRISISAGSKNIISGTEDYLSFDSNILGGTENVLAGSYSNIVGGKNNYIDSISSGYNSLADNIFSITGSGSTGSGFKIISINFPKPRSTASTNILNSIEIKGIDVDPSGYLYRARNAVDTTGFIKRPAILNIKFSGNNTDRSYKIIYDNPLSYNTGSRITIITGLVTGEIDAYSIGSNIYQLNDTISGSSTSTAVLQGILTGSLLNLRNDPNFIFPLISTGFIPTGVPYSVYDSNVPFLTNLFAEGVLSNTTTNLKEKTNPPYSFIDIITGLNSSAGNEIRDRAGAVLNNGYLGLLINGTGFNTSRASGFIDTNQFISGATSAIKYFLPTDENDFANGFKTEFIGYYSGTTLGATRQSSGIYFYFYTPENQIPTGQSGNATGVGYQIEFSPRDGKTSIYWGNSKIPLISSHVLEPLNRTSTSLTSWPITGRIEFETGKFDVYVNNQQAITGYIDPLFTSRNKDNRAFGYGSYGAAGCLNLINNIKFDVGTRNLITPSSPLQIKKGFGLQKPFNNRLPYYLNEAYDSNYNVYPRSRINYDLGSTGVFGSFTGEFYTDLYNDFSNLLDGATFYWFAKGSVNPITSPKTGDSFPYHLDQNAPDFDGYRLAISHQIKRPSPTLSWSFGQSGIPLDFGGYIGDLLNSNGYNDKISFIYDDSIVDRFVVNSGIGFNNRINYTTGSFPTRFRASFDYKASGGPSKDPMGSTLGSFQNGDGGYFYFLSDMPSIPKGPNGISNLNAYYPGEGYSSGSYRIHFNESAYYPSLAVTWNGLYGDGSYIDNQTIGSNDFYDYPNLGDGSWRNIVVDFDSGTFNIFINNELVLSCRDDNYLSRLKTNLNFGLGGQTDAYLYMGLDQRKNYHYFKNFKITTGLENHLLLHMNGTNGSQVFTDSSYNNRTVTGSGTAQISTALSKFGGASAFFTGIDNSFIDIPIDYNFFKKDFTIEAWIRPANIFNGNSYSKAVINTYPHELFGISVHREGSLGSMVSVGNSAFWANNIDTRFAIASGDLVPDQWHHIAVVVNKNGTTLYHSGVAVGNISEKPNPQGSLPSNPFIRIGAITYAGGFNNETYAGFIDEVRFTTTALYTGNFTPPTSAFSDFKPVDIVNDIRNTQSSPIGTLQSVTGSGWATVFTKEEYACLRAYVNDQLALSGRHHYTGVGRTPWNTIDTNNEYYPLNVRHPAFFTQNEIGSLITGLGSNSKNLGLTIGESHSLDYPSIINNFKFSGWSPSTAGTLKTLDDIREDQNMPTGILHFSTGRNIRSTFGYNFYYKGTMTSGLITGRESRFISGPGQINSYISGIIDINNLYYTNNAGTRTNQKTPFLTGFSLLDNIINTNIPFANVKCIDIPIGTNGNDYINDTVRDGSNYSISAWIYPQAPSSANQKNASDVTGSIADMQTLISFIDTDGPYMINRGLFVGIVETSGYRDIENAGGFATPPFNRFSYGGDSLTTLANYSLQTKPGVALDPYINTGAFLFGSYGTIDGGGFLQTFDTAKFNSFGIIDNYFYYPNLDIKYVATEASGRQFTTGINSIIGERGLSLENIELPTYGVASNMTLVPNTWNHIVFSQEGGNYGESILRYYINGTLRASGIKTIPNTSSYNRMIIGATILPSGNTPSDLNYHLYVNAFNGYLAELRIDNYAITGARYNVPAGITDSNGAIFYINASKKEFKRKYNKSYSFIKATGSKIINSASITQNFYSGVYLENLFYLNSFINSPNENIYSGSFERNTGVGNQNSALQFNVYESEFTGFTGNDWMNPIPFNFNKPFNTGIDPKFNLICLYTIDGTGDYFGNYYNTGIQVSGLSNTGFYLLSNQRMNHIITGDFFIGQTGLYTGIDDNRGQIFEINSVYLSGLRPELIGDNFILSGSGLIPIARNITGQKPIRIFGNLYCESGVGSNKQIIDNYNFIYTTGFGSRFIFEATGFNTNLWSGTSLSTGISNPGSTGIFSFSGIRINNPVYIGQTGNIGSGIINILSNGNYIATGNFIRNGNSSTISFVFSVWKSGVTGSRFERVGTGQTFFNTPSLAWTTTIPFSAQSGDKILTSGNLLNVSAGSSLRIFPRSIGILSDPAQEKEFYIKIGPSGLKTKQFLVNDLISKNPKLTGLKFDYFLTDLEINYLNLKDILGDAYDTISQIGFDDVGSSSIFGGTGNYIKGLVNTIGGGIQNKIIGFYNNIPGGRLNTIIDEPESNLPPQIYFSTILGGNNNLISGNITDAIILGGEDNTIINPNKDARSANIASTILGGTGNIISGSYSAVIGGTNNVISGDYAYGLGRNITNRNSGAMVLGDGSVSGKRSLNQNALTLHFNSGIYITGVGTGSAPIIIALNSIPVGSTNVPIGGLYRVGTALNIRVS